MNSKPPPHLFKKRLRKQLYFTTDDTDSTDSQQFAIILNIENHGIHGYGSLTWMPINWPINFSLIQLSEVHSMRTKTKNTPLRGKNKGKSVAMKWMTPCRAEGSAASHLENATFFKCEASQAPSAEWQTTEPSTANCRSSEPIHFNECGGEIRLIGVIRGQK